MTVESAVAFLWDTYTFPSLKIILQHFNVPREELEEELSDLQGQRAIYATQHAKSVKELGKCVVGKKVCLLNAKIQSVFDQLMFVNIPSHPCAGLSPDIVHA